MWTGDGRPDELTAKYAAGVDVFVTECQPDLSRLNLYKYGLPEFLYNYTIDIHHTLTHAAGYLIKQVNPRVGMATHLAFDNDTLYETTADIRAHWDGLFLYGAPDVVVVNVTKDAFCTVTRRSPASPDSPSRTRPSCSAIRCPSIRARGSFPSRGCLAKSNRSSSRVISRSTRGSTTRRTSIGHR